MFTPGTELVAIRKPKWGEYKPGRRVVASDVDVKPGFVVYDWTSLDGTDRARVSVTAEQAALDFAPAPHAPPESFRQVFCAWTGQTPVREAPGPCGRVVGTALAQFRAAQFVGDGKVEIMFSVCVPRHAAIACADSSATSYRVVATSKGAV